MQSWGKPRDSVTCWNTGGKKRGKHHFWRGFSSTTSHWAAVLRGRLLVAQPGRSSAALSVAVPLQGPAVLSPALPQAGSERPSFTAPNSPHSSQLPSQLPTPLTAPNSSHCSKLPSLLQTPLTAPNFPHCSQLPSQLPTPLTASDSPHSSQLPSLPLDTRSLVRVLPGAGSAEAQNMRAPRAQISSPAPIPPLPARLAFTLSPSQPL